MNNVEIIGAKELIKALEELPNQLGVQLLRDTNRSGARFIRDELKGVVPSQKARNKIQIKNDPDDKTAVQVGLTTDAYYVRFLEKGTIERKTKGKGPKQFKAAARGRITPRPFFDQMLERSSQSTVDFIFEKLGRTIESFLKRNIKKLNK
jgi:HK97 gp10 family phage protein